MGRGFPIVSSTKQKLNTKSSTETEIVGADDFMPAICWTRYFMKAQGYGVRDNVLFQDNKSSILLEKNGKASSSKRTKHINIRYFFITDRVSDNEVSVVWCPTGGHDWRLRDEATPRRSVQKIQGPNHGSDPEEGSGTRKDRQRRRQSEEDRQRCRQKGNKQDQTRKGQSKEFGTARRSGTTGLCWESNPGPRRSGSRARDKGNESSGKHICARGARRRREM
jgi:hypothetical protein